MFREFKGQSWLKVIALALVITLVIPYRELAFARSYRGELYDSGDWAKDFGSAMFYAPMTGGASLTARAFSQAVIATGTHYGWSTSSIGIASGIPTALTQPFGNPFRDPEKFITNVVIAAIIVVATVGVGSMLNGASGTAGGAEGVAGAAGGVEGAAGGVGGAAGGGGIAVGANTAGTSGGILNSVGNFFVNAGNTVYTYGKGAVNLVTNSQVPIKVLENGELITKTMSAWEAGLTNVSATFSANSPALIQALKNMAISRSASNVVGVIAYNTNMDKRTAFVLSSVVGGAAVGFSDPSFTLGKYIPKPTLTDMGNSALVGALGGLGQSLTIVAIDGNKIKDEKSPGALSQIAGMVVGSYATDLGRATVNPLTYAGKIEGFFERTQDGYQKINYSAEQKDIIKEGSVIQSKDFEQKYGTPFDSNTGISTFNQYQAEIIAPDIVRITDTQLGLSNAHIASNLFINPLRQTVNNWPQLTTSALEILAVSSLGKDKQYLTPLVGGITNTFAAPTLNAINSTLGLEFMDETDTLLHAAMLKQIAFSYKMANLNQKIEDATSTEELNTLLRNENLLPEGMSLSSKPEVKDWLLKQSNVTELIKQNPELSQQIDKSFASGQDKAIARTMARFNLERIYKNPQEYLGNLYKDSGLVGTDLVLEHAGLTGWAKVGAITGQSWRGMRFGLLDAMVGGGLQALIGKSLKSDSSGYLLAGGLANIGTALIRGAAWSNSYDLNNGPEWQNSWELPSDSPRYDQFLETTGLQPKPPADQNKAYVEIKFSKPSSREAALGQSLILAGQEFIRDALYFGYPQFSRHQDYNNVSALTVLNYTNRLRYLSGLGFNELVSYSVGSANISAAVTNLKTSASTVPWLSDIFSVQHQRFVATDAPRLPYTVQTLGYSDSLLNATTSFFAPFNKVYIKSATEGGELLRRLISKKEMKDIQENNNNIIQSPPAPISLDKTSLISNPVASNSSFLEEQQRKAQEMLNRNNQI